LVGGPVASVETVGVEPNVDKDVGRGLDKDVGRGLLKVKSVKSAKSATCVGVGLGEKKEAIAGPGGSVVIELVWSSDVVGGAWQMEGGPS